MGEKGKKEIEFFTLETDDRDRERTDLRLTNANLFSSLATDTPLHYPLTLEGNSIR